MEKRILAWADEEFLRRGKWPTKEPGSAIAAVPWETWPAVDMALRVGGRGLTGGSSLAPVVSPKNGLHKL